MKDFSSYRSRSSKAKLKKRIKLAQQRPHFLISHWNSSTSFKHENAEINYDQQRCQDWRGLGKNTQNKKICTKSTPSTPIKPKVKSIMRTLTSGEADDGDTEAKPETMQDGW
ncbi:hypothetical protein Fmac_018647 [Flemingia macrophylla]|uniref:Uncharacterized protein n=1 Tax=Flemingia macrophylla TaxID=520843 RepID=A0ABD1M5P8_9FABA